MDIEPGHVSACSNHIRVVLTTNGNINGANLYPYQPSRSNGLARVPITYRLLISAAKEECLVSDWVIKVRLQEVLSEASWRFIGHLDSVLQDGDRELVRGVTGEPEPKVWVGVLWNQLLTQFLHGCHPGHGQVTVL